MAVQVASQTTARVVALAGLFFSAVGFAGCDGKRVGSSASSDAGQGRDADAADDVPAMDAISSSGGTSGNGGVGGNGAVGGSGGVAGNGGNGGRGGSGNSAAYVPDTIVPYDGKYLPGGSIEDSPGIGWDRCLTHTPGMPIAEASEQASNGAKSMVFDSEECTSIICRNDNPSSSQIYFFFNNVPPYLGNPVGLYFDMMNLNAAPPTGTMALYATDLACRGEQMLVDVPLADLAPGPAWETRCVNLAFASLPPALGIAMTGGTYKIAVDALRLGPACQKPRDCTAGCVCQPGQNQSCNDNPTVSSYRGACGPDSRCICYPGVAKNAATGKCQ